MLELPYIVCMSKRKSPQSARSAGKRIKLLASKVAYQGKVFSVSSDKVREPSGIVAQRDVIHHSGSVVILAIDESGKEPRVLLGRQYRYAAHDYLWELPAGRIDPGEKPLPAGKRELIEETGYRAKNWKRALFFYASPGFLDETMTIYLARDLVAGEAQPEEDESIDCKLFRLSRVIEMIVSGAICDGKTIAGVLWFAETQQGRGR